jgi:hypothetical protein
MVPIMRRISFLLGLTLLVASIGCKHVGGKCDCNAHPGDAAPHTITNPHPSAPVPGTLPPKGN